MEYRQWTIRAGKLTMRFINQKGTSSHDLWYSDNLHYTTSAGSSIFVANHNILHLPEVVLCNLSDYQRI